MAKRNRNSNGTSSYEILKFCAYWTLVIAAVAGLLAFVFGLLHKCGVDIAWAGRLISICSLISQIALLVTVIFGAYKYTIGKTTVFKAFFWVGVILVVLGLVGVSLGITL